MQPRAISYLLVTFVALTLAGYAGAQEAVRYQPKAGSKFVYQVNITADINGTIDRMKGTITYTVESSGERQTGLAFSGGVNSSKSTAAPVVRGPRGPRGPSLSRRPTPTRGPQGWFESTPFKGLTTTGNELVITSRGAVQSLTGDSQLPYLLGNLSLLVFEPLPEDYEKAWDVERALVISQEKEREFGPPRFGPRGPRGPFAQNETEKKLTAGSQLDSFAIKSDDGKLVTISKTHKAKSAETEDGTLELAGSGTWVFNRVRGMPESLEFKQELVVNVKNVSVKVPTTISYRLMTDEELKQIAAEREKRAAEYAKRREEEERKAKEEGRTVPERTVPERAARLNTLNTRNQPLSDADKKEILGLIESGTTRSVMQAFHKLQVQSPPELDDDIRAAIRPLLKHENRVIQHLAERAAKQWPLDATAEAASAPTTGLRTWTDTSGTFTIEAEFLGLADGAVRLKKKDGKELTVPLDRLSDSDQKVAQQLHAKSNAPSNPFE